MYCRSHVNLIMYIHSIKCAIISMYTCMHTAHATVTKTKKPTVFQWLCIEETHMKFHDDEETMYMYYSVENWTGGEVGTMYYSMENWTGGR